MRARALGAAALAAVGVPAASSGADDRGHGNGEPAGASVTMPARYFSPVHVAVLPGESVTWRNDDHAPHVVRSVDAGFDSGRIEPGGAFAFSFAEPGRYRYRCSIHRHMTGTVEVSPVLLETEGPPPRVGRHARLAGRARAGAGPVTIERVDGGRAAAVATASPDADGSFAAAVRVDGPARLRARQGATAAPAISVRPAPVVTLSARRAGRTVVARVTVVPPQRGGRVAVERYSRERFGWVPAGTAPLRGGHSARIAARMSRPLRLRARLTRSARGWSPATSRSDGVAGARSLR